MPRHDLTEISIGARESFSRLAESPELREGATSDVGSYIGVNRARISPLLVLRCVALCEAFLPILIHFSLSIICVRSAVLRSSDVRRALHCTYIRFRRVPFWL